MNLAVGAFLTSCLLLESLLVEARNNDRVRLSDVSSITLHLGQVTNGRRSSPVPQLSCVGGTAGCHTFQPRVVQCLNQGSDGSDAQWECKTDMDVEYRFGRIQVSCEGYDYPDDPYILDGSCGLEYEIDLTEEGRRVHGVRRDVEAGWGTVVLVIAVIVLVMLLVWCCGGCGGPRRGGPHRTYRRSHTSASSSRRSTGRSRTTSGFGGTGRR